MAGTGTRCTCPGDGTPCSSAILSDTRRYQAWYYHAMWDVVYLPAAEQERDKLPGNERVAIRHAVEKLEALGPDLPFPHSGGVQG